MLAQLSEQLMHRVRWVLTLGWLLLITSLLYDPWTAALTKPDHPWSPLRLTNECVQVQGACVGEAPYPIGATLFWGAIVPSAIFILLVFGHELWRRICPLSFLSQIPRALGWQRQFKRENPTTGKVRYELAKVQPDSWLGRNYLYLQFGYLFVGLCGRILFFNADRLVLAVWILTTIAASITVGYFYGGKSWCQYFCPMAPVQSVFSEPRGLVGSKAHMSEQRITQSMCRTVLPDGKEQSACVACQSPCIDIDSERTYWDGLNKPEESFMRYGYVGLVVGYFVYYYLYAGNWNYYFSGVWNRDPNQLAALMSPGLYLFGQVINIPKLFAVPLVLGACTAIGIGLGRQVERSLKAFYQRRESDPSPDLIQHRIYAVCTFAVFNFFFIFAARPLILLAPIWVQHVYDLILVFLSTMWLQRSWRRSPDLYSRENLANRFRKQLDKLQINVSHYLEGRSLAELDTNEVYVLAKVLPDFTREKRHEAYKGVVRESLEEGYMNTASSLEVLQNMRHELGISDDEHEQVLEELGIEDPELLNPNHRRTLENQIRLNGYQKSLERLMLLRQQQPNLTALDQVLQGDVRQVRALRSEYSITAQEEDWVLSGLAPDAENRSKAEHLLARLAELQRCCQALDHSALQAHPVVVQFLQDSIKSKQTLIVQLLLNTLSNLNEDPDAMALANALQQLTLVDALQLEDWRDRLHPTILQILTQPGTSPTVNEVDSIQDVMSYIEILLDSRNPLLQAAILYLIAQLDVKRAQLIIQHQEQQFRHPLVQATATQILNTPKPTSLVEFPQLEKLVYLANSDFFHQTQTQTLITLGDRATIRTYTIGDFITEAGDTCRELLLLISGAAKIQYQFASGVRVEQLQPGKILDELEVLTHSTAENTILADDENTRILAIPVDAFDDLLNHDPDFARRVLKLESQHLKRFMQPLSLSITGPTDP